MGFWVDKQNLQQREMRGNSSRGLCHSTSGSDQGARETCQPGWSTPNRARRDGGARVFMEPLCLSLHPCPSTLLCLFHSFSLSLTHTSLWQNWKLTTCRRQQVYHREGRWTCWTRPEEKRRKFCPFFPFAYMSICPIYLFISPSGSCLPVESEGLGICLWCVCRFVYMFKVGRFCLTRTMEDRDLGEDRWLPL